MDRGKSHGDTGHHTRSHACDRASSCPLGPSVTFAPTKTDVTVCFTNLVVLGMARWNIMFPTVPVITGPRGEICKTDHLTFIPARHLSFLRPYSLSPVFCHYASGLPTRSCKSHRKTRYIKIQFLNATTVTTHDFTSSFFLVNAYHGHRFSPLQNWQCCKGPPPAMLHLLFQCHLAYFFYFSNNQFIGVILPNMYSLILQFYY